MSFKALSDPPVTCDVAFKEWAGVCEALASGGQTVILRKGGIAEGPGGFTVEHRAFWLYPTIVHQADQGLRENSPQYWIAQTVEGSIGLNALAIVEHVARVDDLDRLRRLEPCHIWTAETIEKRFHYRQPGLWVLVARIFRRHEPNSIAVTPEHAGCKTWVPLDHPIATEALEPAVDAARFQSLLHWVRDVLEPGR